MKLTTITFVSVDGVMQGIGGPDEDRSGGFELGGWTTPLWDAEAGAFLNEDFTPAPTPSYSAGGPTTSSPAPGGRSTTPPSTRSPMPCTPDPTTSHPPRSPTRRGPIDGAVRRPSGRCNRIEGQAGRRTPSPRQRRADPVPAEPRSHRPDDPLDLSGDCRPGTRLFPDAGRDTALELAASRSTPRGVTIQVYTPSGRLEVGTSTADLQHVS